MRHGIAIALALVAVAGCARKNDKIVTVEVRGADDIRLLNTKTTSDGLYLALRDARDRDANLDLLDYKMVFWRGVPAEESAAIEDQLRKALTQLSMGRRVTVERRRSAVSVVLGSPLFWILALAGGGFAIWKKKTSRR